MNLKVYKTQMYITNNLYKLQNDDLSLTSFMRVLIDHASPFLDAVHVIIGTGDVMGA